MTERGIFGILPRIFKRDELPLRKYCHRLTLDGSEAFLIRRALEDYCGKLQEPAFRSDCSKLLDRVKEFEEGYE